MERLKPYAKAAAAGVYAGVIALIPVVDGGVTVKEGLIVAAAVIVGSGLVYAVPNKPTQ